MPVNHKAANAILKRLANDAIACQDACNVSGIIMFFEKAASELAGVSAFLDTDDMNYVNHHPVLVLISDKLIDMVGLRSAPHIESPLKAERRDAIAHESLALKMDLETLRNQYRQANPGSLMPPREWYAKGIIGERIVKIARLCGSQVGGSAYFKASEECEKLRDMDLQAA
jgi:hypothetical protein